MYGSDFKTRVQHLRAQGKTYSEIATYLKIEIPKSTLSGWCKGVTLPAEYKLKLQNINRLHTKKRLLAAADYQNARWKKFYDNVEKQNEPLIRIFNSDLIVRKIVLTTLYLAEGSKTKRASMMFGNSDPILVKMFVNLLRQCYKIDESKFRVTVQCRADQNVSVLETFWSKITKIPLVQFYSARIDKRSLGKVSRKLDYKGVCRLDYFSSAIDLELKHIAFLMKKI